LQGEIIGYFSFHFVPPLAVIVPVSYGVEGSTVDKAVVFANALKVRGIKLSVAKIRDHAHSVVGDAPSEIAMFVQIVTGYVFPSPGGVC
jgi:hypothetical protein